MYDVLIAFVGKPSAGKSSLMNALTDAKAKVGSYPFTTIEPNHGVTFYPMACPCARFGKTAQCKPRHGKCIDGTRFVPVKIMDVAGLIPGASEGLGLGNKFLDDLRHADALVHVVDVSGTTNEKGENASGYDPINDIDWFRSEVHAWILNNLKKKWDSVVRRHLATKSSEVETMQGMLSGYGATKVIIQRFLSKLPFKKSLEEWDVSLDLPKVVDTFIDERFPTVIALNKIDMSESDKNISRICEKYGDTNLVYTSALAEIYLRKMKKSNYIVYSEGSDNFQTLNDLTEEEKNEHKLIPLDDQNKRRLEKIKDLVLFRYGGTGVQDAIIKAIDMLQLVPVFPVKNINTFTCDSGERNGGVFRDCFFVQSTTTVRELASKISGELDRYYLGAETVGGVMLAEDELFTKDRCIICYKTTRHLEDDS